MPRRKQPFIKRSSAHTYHVIRKPTSENPDHHVLVSDPSDPSPPNSNALATEELEQTYSPRDFALGEFGFPDDGYDYSKHFRTIGGGGGVFMSAATGLADPDAVRNLLYRDKPAQQSHQKSSTSKDVVILKEPLGTDSQAIDGADGDPVNQLPLDEQASAMKQQALDQIHRDRKRNAELDQVLYELNGDELLTENDTDAELDTQVELNDDDTDTGPIRMSEQVENTDVSINEPSSDGGDPDSYFDKLINGEDEEEDEDHDGALKSNFEPLSWEGIVPEYREPRLLDQQFETFMQGFEDDESESEPDEELEELKRKRDEQENAEDTPKDDFLKLLNDEESQLLFGEGASVHVEETDEDTEDILNGFSELKLWDTSENKPKGEIPEDETRLEDSQGENVNEEIQEYRKAEFEQGMERVIDSYTRVPVSEALSVGEGVNAARDALTRFEGQDVERKERLELEGRLNEDGLSDGNDSELDTLFDEQFDGPTEQWDCETIISTYTNVDNHPSIIDAPCRTMRRRNTSSRHSVIQLDPRTQAPKDFLPAGATGAAAASARKEIDFGSRIRTNGGVGDSAEGSADIANGRHKEESKEEKKRRKAKVKEIARQRRSMKSEMKKAFGAESVKQSKHSASLGNAKVAVQF